MAESQRLHPKDYAFRKRLGITRFDKRWMYVSKFSDLSRREKP